MELRRSTHFHFINAVKGSSVTKSMNVDSRGRPGLKFKEIKEIYNFKDTVDPNQVPRIILRDDLESLPAKCYANKVNNPDFSLVRGIKIKTEFETYDSSCSNAGDERADDLDDLSFGSMTLKQFKKKCKSKKRKCSNLFNKDNENDLEEPLIRLKSKLSKNMKSKRKSSRSVSATSPNTASLIKSEMFRLDEDLLQPNQNLFSPFEVEVEVPEPGHSKCQTISGVTSVFDFSYDEQVDSTAFLSKGVPETTDARVLEMDVPYPTNEPQHSTLNEVSYECRGNLEAKFDVGVSGWDIVKVDRPEVLSCVYSDLSEFSNDDYVSCSHDYNSYSMVEVPETTISCGLDRGSTLYPVEHVCSVSNAVSCEYIEDVIPRFGASSSGWEIVKVDDQELISYQCSNLQELGQESYAVYALPYDVSLEFKPPTMDCSPDLDDSFKSNSSENEMAWQTSSIDRTEVHEMENDHSLQCLENINEVSAFGSRLNSLISFSSNAGLSWSSPCLNPAIHSVPVSRHSPSAGEQSQLPDSIDTDVDATDMPVSSPGHLDNHQRKQHHPERLHSSRKAISPASQERLLRSMELTGLDDEQRQKCRGKLYFGKQTNHKILRARGLDQLGRDGAAIKPKSLMREVKQDKKRTPTKGILKVTHQSRSVPHVSNACTTVQRCTQSAIAFTQRQMQDIESLASKLTVELKSMKDIVMGKLHSELEDSAATAMNENADEVRIAVDSATKTEETTRKWLSMMARDCNRFHKIMKLTEDSTATSDRVIQKERKISFADEAGGKLCHIKFFKDDRVTDSLQQCDIEKQRLQVEQF